MLICPKTIKMKKDLIRLSRSIIGHDEVLAVSRVLLEDGYLGMGKVVEDFEEDLASFLQVPIERVISVSSGTAALHLAVQAITKPGDEVLVPSLTYVACFQAISATGAVPVACEVFSDSALLDLEDARKRLSLRTKAVMPVHYASYPGDINKIYQFAKQYDLRVVEDAAHAFGCIYRGNKIGSFGDIVCFSFDGIKNITSGEGGAVVTQDAEVARYIKDARLLGVQKDTEKRYKGERSWEFDVQRIGFRYHMSNIMAAIGRVQLQKLEDEFAPKRKTLARLYRERLSKIDGVALLETDLENVIPHIQPIRVLNGNRDKLRIHLELKGVQTGIHYKPNHLLSFFGGGAIRLPVTERLYEELLSLPLHPDLSKKDVNFVIDAVENFYRNLRS